MDTAAVEALKYPIGRHEEVKRFDRRAVNAGIDALAAFPSEVRKRLEPLSETDLAKRYRPGGWTVRQVAHHLADSHMNIYIRFKWALTEEAPTIKAYDESRWAELPDYRAPIALALDGLEYIHARWVALMRSMTDEDFRRAFFHPETETWMPLYDRVASYVWHGRHHLAHIEAALRG